MNAYEDGLRAGRADRLLGVRSTYADFIELAPGYSRDYALGYHAGLFNLEM